MSVLHSFTSFLCTLLIFVSEWKLLFWLPTTIFLPQTCQETAGITTTKPTTTSSPSNCVSQSSRDNCLSLLLIRYHSITTGLGLEKKRKSIGLSPLCAQLVCNDLLIEWHVTFFLPCQWLRENTATTTQKSITYLAFSLPCVDINIYLCVLVLLLRRAQKPTTDNNDITHEYPR